MNITCFECGGVNDLTHLDVGVGHVFDCEHCGKQLRAISTGESRPAEQVRPERPLRTKVQESPRKLPASPKE